MNNTEKPTGTDPASAVMNRAQAGLAAGATMDDLVREAEGLAVKTVEAMQMYRDGALLRSVHDAIQNPALRGAFLESIGETLLGA